MSQTLYIMPFSLWSRWSRARHALSHLPWIITAHSAAQRCNAHQHHHLRVSKVQSAPWKHAQSPVLVKSDRGGERSGTLVFFSSWSDNEKHGKAGATSGAVFWGERKLMCARLNTNFRTHNLLLLSPSRRTRHHINSVPTSCTSVQWAYTKNFRWEETIRPSGVVDIPWALKAKIRDELGACKAKLLSAWCLAHAFFVGNVHSCTLPGFQLRDL
jgi:hypothetical protein